MRPPELLLRHSWALYGGLGVTSHCTPSCLRPTGLRPLAGTTTLKNLKDFGFWNMHVPGFSSKQSRNCAFWRAQRTTHRPLPPPKRVWAHPHRQFEHFLRAPTPMFAPPGKLLRGGNKVAIDALTYLFFLTP